MTYYDTSYGVNCELKKLEDIMKNNVNDEKFVDVTLMSLVGILLLGLLGFVCISLFGFYKFVAYGSEKECFDFYKENNYILDKCSIYENKLIEVKND